MTCFWFVNECHCPQDPFFVLDHLFNSLLRTFCDMSLACLQDLRCPIVNAVCPCKLAEGIWWQVLCIALCLDLVTSTLQMWFLKLMLCVTDLAAECCNGSKEAVAAAYG